MFVLTIILLIFINIPVAVFLGWLFFEQPDERQSAMEAVLAIGKMLLSPKCYLINLYAPWAFQ